MKKIWIRATEISGILVLTLGKYSYSVSDNLDKMWGSLEFGQMMDIQSQYRNAAGTAEQGLTEDELEEIQSSLKEHLEI